MAPTPSRPGSSTMRSARVDGAAAAAGAGGGGAGARQLAASAPASRRPGPRGGWPLRRAVARTNDEFRAAHAKDRGRRLDVHGIRALLRNAARDHGERASGEGGL